MMSIIRTSNYPDLLSKSWWLTQKECPRSRSWSWVWNTSEPVLSLSWSGYFSFPWSESWSTFDFFSEGMLSKTSREIFLIAMGRFTSNAL